MTSFLLRRLAWFVPALLGITLVTFLAVHLAPGDPASLGGGADGELAGAGDARVLFRAEHLLDEPLWRQYLHFVGPFDLSPRGHTLFGGSGAHPWHGLCALDLGDEFQRPGVRVFETIASKLAVTAPLAACAIACLFLAGVPLGVWSALRRGRATDRVLRALLVLFHALPAFWLGLVLVLAFGATGLAWLPVLGLRSVGAETLGTFDRALDVLAHSVLPVATLVLPGLAYVARQTRSALLEVLEQDFVRAARARGVPERDVVVKHALRNALVPIVTLLGTLLPALLGGSVIVETVFGIPGLGQYAYEAMLARDYSAILGVTTVSAVLTLTTILAADAACAWLDPRIRHG